jgi:hypothetical protein
MLPPRLTASSLASVLLILTAAPVFASAQTDPTLGQTRITPPTDTVNAVSGTEWVYLYALDDLAYRALIVRRSGEPWLLEYGTGCLGISRYQGRQVLVVSPGLFFAGIGSQIALADGSGVCRIWNSEQLG